MARNLGRRALDTSYLLKYTHLRTVSPDLAATADKLNRHNLNRIRG